MAGATLEAAQPITIMAGAMALARLEVPQLKMTILAVAASSLVIMLENVLYHAMTAASTVVNQVIFLVAARNQRKSVLMTAPAGNVTKSATLLVIALVVVEVEEIGRVTSAVRLVILRVSVLQAVVAVVETDRVTSVVRSATWLASVPRLPSERRLVALEGA